MAVVEVVVGVVLLQADVVVGVVLWLAAVVVVAAMAAVVVAGDAHCVRRCSCSCRFSCFAGSETETGQQCCMTGS